MKKLQTKKISSFYPRQDGFSLIETITYIFIATILMITISSLVMSIFNSRQYFISASEVNHNARFIVHYLTNRLHNVDNIVDASPAVEEFHFYQLPDKRFSLELIGDDLAYREVQDTGAGFPEQSSSTPILLNNLNINVSNLDLLAVNNYQGMSNKGIQISFTLSSREPGNFAHYQKDFSTFISIR